MERRSVLRRLGALGGLLGTAGCLTGSSTNTSGPTTNTMNKTGECPTLNSNVDRTICDDVSKDSTPRIILSADPTSFTVDTTDQSVETLQFTLSNQSDQPFVIDSRSWAIARVTDGNWNKIESGDPSEQSITVSPGGKHRWSLSLTPHPTQQTKNTSFITANLEDGNYVFAVNGKLKRSRQPLQVECQAQFTLTTINASATEG